MTCTQGALPEACQTDEGPIRDDPQPHDHAPWTVQVSGATLALGLMHRPRRITLAPRALLLPWDRK